MLFMPAGRLPASSLVIDVRWLFSKFSVFRPVRAPSPAGIASSLLPPRSKVVKPLRALQLPDMEAILLFDRSKLVSPLKDNILSGTARKPQPAMLKRVSCVRAAMEAGIVEMLFPLR